jgi:hypothetical protein
VGFGFQGFENGTAGAIRMAYEVARNGAFLKINFGQRFSGTPLAYLPGLIGA